MDIAPVPVLYQKSAGRQLHHAQRIAAKAQPHGLGVDGDGRTEVEAVGKVAVIEVDSQGRSNSGEIRFGLVTPEREGSPPKRGWRHPQQKEWCPGEDSNLHGR